MYNEYKFGFFKNMLYNMFGANVSANVCIIKIML